MAALPHNVFPDYKEVFNAVDRSADAVSGREPWYWKGGRIRSDSCPEGFARAPKEVGMAIVRMRNAIKYTIGDSHEKRSC